MFSNGHWMFDPFFTIPSALHGVSLIVLLRRLCREQVPFGPLAFMPGKLVHTNEVTALLGDNWFAKCSAKQAQKIVARRMKCESVHPSKAFVSFYSHHSALLRCVQQRVLLYNGSPDHWSEGTHFPCGCYSPCEFGRICFWDAWRIWFISRKCSVKWNASLIICTEMLERACYAYKISWG